MKLCYSYDDEYDYVDFEYEVDDSDIDFALCDILYKDLFGNIEALRGKEAKNKVKVALSVLIDNYDLRNQMAEDYNEELHDYFNDDAWDWFNDTGEV